LEVSWKVDGKTPIYVLAEGTKKKKKKKKPKKKKAHQSDPPRVGLSKIFTNGVYPEGEIQPYKDECVFRSFHAIMRLSTFFVQQCMEDYI
jgi:hypothetical protein